MKEITQEELAEMMEQQGENVLTTCFYQEITQESISRFIDIIEREIRTVGISELRIEFSSIGGAITEAHTLIRYLNSLSEDGVTIILTASDMLFSAASTVFLKSKVFKCITPDTLMLLHTPLISQRTREKESRDIIHKRNEAYKRKYLDEIETSGILSGDELIKLKDGRDIYIESDRLHKYMTETDEKYYLGRTEV